MDAVVRTDARKVIALGDHDERARWTADARLCESDSGPGVWVSRKGLLARSPGRRAQLATDVAASVATFHRVGSGPTALTTKGPDLQGLSMRRRGLEPPPS